MSCPVGIKLHAIAGWGGDRLVHTERIDAEHPGQRQITHTVYEPESFTPLLRLSTATKQQGKPNALVQALGAGLQDGDEDDHQALVMMQAMLGAMPKDLQDSAQASMQQALQQGLPPSALAAMPDEGKNTLQRLSDLREQLEKQEQSEQTPIEVLYFHCDHLGTPLALTDQNQQIVWAARLDPWGNVEQEFNPHHIDQAIRLPGQQHDKDTGLYYNRHRYYDPAIGSYINQDPIGLSGGANLERYSQNSPLHNIDPLGLNTIAIGAGAGAAVGGPPGALIGAAIGLGVLIVGAAWLATRPAPTTVASTAAPATDPWGVAIDPKADKLTSDHAAAIGNRADPRYGGNCSPDEYDRLRDSYKKECGNADSLGSCKADMSKSEKSSRMAAYGKCARARENMMNKCFAGGDLNHRIQAGNVWNAYKNCGF